MTIVTFLLKMMLALIIIMIGLKIFFDDIDLMMMLVMMMTMMMNFLMQSCSRKGGLSSRTQLARHTPGGRRNTQEW